MGHLKSKVVITSTETEKMELVSEKSHDYKKKKVRINEIPEEIVEYVQINVSPTNGKKTHKFQKKKPKLKEKYTQEKTVSTTSNTIDFCDKCEVFQADKMYLHKLLKTAFHVLCEEIIFNLAVTIILITNIMLEISSTNTPEDLKCKKRLKEIIKKLYNKRMTFKRLQMKDPLKVNFTNLIYQQSKRGQEKDTEENCVTDCN